MGDRWGGWFAVSGREYDAEFSAELQRRRVAAVVRAMPGRYRDIDLEPDIAGWADRLAHGHVGNLVVTGKVGAGKTAAAWQAIHRATATGWRGAWAFWKATDLADALRPGDQQQQVIEQTRSTDLLVIDDLGSAGLTSSWQLEQMLRIIDVRWEWQRPLLVTSNLPPKDFRDALGARLTSRLQDSAFVVEMLVSDRRRAS